MRFLLGRYWLRSLLRLLGALSLNWFCVLRGLLHLRWSLGSLRLRLGMIWLNLWGLFASHWFALRFSRFGCTLTTGFGGGQGFAYCGSTLTRGARVRSGVH